MKKALPYAFQQTLPVLFGYLFMGIAFGLLLQKAGYNFLWALFVSVTVYAGSLQFVLVSFFAGGVSLLTVAVMTLLINSRHMFYGLSFIDRFKKMGAAYPYMIFSLTDETYSLLCSVKAPRGVDENKLTFAIAVLDHAYWITGSVLGALAGQFIVFNSTGVDFAMTALFVVIFVDQWRLQKEHGPALLGAACGLAALLLLGPENFILPALAAAVAALLLLKEKLDPAQKEDPS